MPNPFCKESLGKSGAILPNKLLQGEDCAWPFIFGGSQKMRLNPELLTTLVVSWSSAVLWSSTASVEVVLSVSSAESLYPALQVSRAACLHHAVQNQWEAFPILCSTLVPKIKQIQKPRKDFWDLWNLSVISGYVSEYVLFSLKVADKDKKWLILEKRDIVVISVILQGAAIALSIEVNVITQPFVMLEVDSEVNI